MEERDLFAHAAKVGEQMQARLKSLENQELVGEVRGVGLIAAVELVKQADPRKPFKASDGVGAYCAQACMDEGVILRNMGDAMAFCPPLVITEDQIDELCSKFERALAKTTDWVKREGLL